MVLRNIRIFGYTVVLNLILRVAMYAISGVIMQGKVPSYASFTKEELNSTPTCIQTSSARPSTPRVSTSSQASWRDCYACSYSSSSNQWWSTSKSGRTAKLPSTSPCAASKRTINFDHSIQVSRGIEFGEAEAEYQRPDATQNAVVVLFCKAAEFFR